MVIPILLAPLVALEPLVLVAPFVTLGTFLDLENESEENEVVCPLSVVNMGSLVGLGV